MTPDENICTTCQGEWVGVGKRQYRHPDGHEVANDGWLYRAVHHGRDGRQYVARFNRLADAKRWAESGELI